VGDSISREPPQIMDLHKVRKQAHQPITNLVILIVFGRIQVNDSVKQIALLALLDQNKVVLEGKRTLPGGYLHKRFSPSVRVTHRIVTKSLWFSNTCTRFSRARSAGSPAAFT